MTRSSLPRPPEMSLLVFLAVCTLPRAPRPPLVLALLFFVGREVPAKNSTGTTAAAGMWPERVLPMAGCDRGTSDVATSNVDGPNLTRKALYWSVGDRW